MEGVGIVALKIDLWDMFEASVQGGSRMSNHPCDSIVILLVITSITLGLHRRFSLVSVHVT